MSAQRWPKLAEAFRAHQFELTWWLMWLVAGAGWLFWEAFQ